MTSDPSLPRDLPLVSVGIPTYNRAPGLRRAAESVLRQDYPNVELVISDNASTDGTPAVGEALMREDPRVRYLRQRTNLGPIPNFLAARRAARGSFFMWLSDDDWIDPSYVRECLAVLQSDPQCALACGLARYYRDGRYATDDLRIDLTAPSAWRRVLRCYYVTVLNGPFYGLMRREHVPRVPLYKVVGCDWIAVASLSHLGRVRTLPSVRIHRQLTGMSRSHRTNASECRVPGFQASFPHLSTAVQACRDILHGPAYASRGFVQRALLAGGAFAAIYLARTRLAKDAFRARRALHQALFPQRRDRAPQPHDELPPHACSECYAP